MLSAILVVGLLAATFGIILGFSAIRFKVEGDPLVEQIDKLLPQTQCGQCGYPGCKPYAEAIANESAEINQCPPGGEQTIHDLAELLNLEIIPLNPENGAPTEKTTVVIDEANCIGCTLCIQACPIDAIAGAAKQMHTVIQSECTGCDLCIPPCPVDCIIITPVKHDFKTWQWDKPAMLAENKTDIA